MLFRSITSLPYQSPFSRNQSWWVSQALDIELMRDAAELLTGKHDFSAFRAAGCSSPSPHKELREILVTKASFYHSTLQIEIEANSFLQHMVRIITGTLLEVGQGHKSIYDVAKALESGQRQLAGITAPAHGLYFLSAIYPHGVIKWPLEVIDN